MLAFGSHGIFFDLTRFKKRYHEERNGLRGPCDTRRKTRRAPTLPLSLRGLSVALRQRHPMQLRHESNNRSEEHTSELQSLMRISYAVFCLKKKQQNKST